jgi:hypothetical protein
MLKSKRQELRKIRQETFAANDGVERAEQMKKANKTKLELQVLKNKLRAARGISQRYERFRRRIVRRSKGQESGPTSPSPARKRAPTDH